MFFFEPPQMFFVEPPQGIMLVLIPKVTLGPPKALKKQVVILKPHLLKICHPPHLVSLFLTSPISALLVGRDVIA
jgi:hypothetical protein